MYKQNVIGNGAYVLRLTIHEAQDVYRFVCFFSSPLVQVLRSAILYRLVRNGRNGVASRILLH